MLRERQVLLLVQSETVLIFIGLLVLRGRQFNVKWTFNADSKTVFKLSLNFRAASETFSGVAVLLVQRVRQFETRLSLYWKTRHTLCVHG